MSIYQKKNYTMGAILDKILKNTRYKDKKR